VKGGEARNLPLSMIESTFKVDEVGAASESKTIWRKFYPEYKSV
jgi:hypothetical protein